MARRQQWRSVGRTLGQLRRKRHWTLARATPTSVLDRSASHLRTPYVGIDRARKVTSTRRHLVVFEPDRIDLDRIVTFRLRLADRIPVCYLQLFRRTDTVAMSLKHEPKYPSRRAYVLKVRSDATPATLAGCLENLVTGSRREFASGEELVASIASDIQASDGAGPVDPGVQ